MSARLVVLASGTGTLLQAVLDGCADGRLDATVVFVLSDVPTATALDRARDAGVAATAIPPSDFADRGAWDEHVATVLLAQRPDLVVSAGFMRILGPAVLAAFPDRIVNTHPALLPSFPGAHGVRDALAHGVKVTGCTIHLVDAGIDTGPILAQRAVDVLPDDDEASLHERIKTVERDLLVATISQLIEGAR